MYRKLEDQPAPTANRCSRCGNIEPHGMDCGCDLIKPTPPTKICTWRCDCAGNGPGKTCDECEYYKEPLPTEADVREARMDYICKKCGQQWPDTATGRSDMVKHSCDTVYAENKRLLAALEQAQGEVERLGNAMNAMHKRAIAERNALRAENARLVENVKEQNAQINNLVLENGIMGAAIHVYQGGEVSDFMESMCLVDEARQHMAKNANQAERDYARAMWDKLAVLVNPPGALAQVFALEKERNALLVALAKGSCSTCFYYSPDGKCGQDCDGYDNWEISIDLSREASEFLRRLQLADVSKLAAATHDYPKVVHDRDEAVALLKQCRPYVSNLAPDDLQAALAATEAK